MKRILFILILIIIIYDNYNNKFNILDYYLLDDYLHNINVNNHFVNNIDNLNNNIYTMNNDITLKSRILNCLYVSRYMGQDWNKKYFYMDNFDNLSDYCENLLKYIEDTLYEHNKNINHVDSEKFKKYLYYRYINEFILHARECIDLTGNNNIEECIKIEHLIESQTNIKKNICLFNVNDDLCNKKQIDNKTPTINGYLDRNMTNFGRDFYSQNRNYYIHKMSPLNINDTYNTENNIIGTTLILTTIVGVSILIYKYFN
jgi:hypothetical protein